MTENDTIVAISTSLGLGGIAIVRLSGPSAVKIADDFFCARNGVMLKDAQHSKMNFGHFHTESFDEKGYAVVFREPNSFTGETVVELQVHGGSITSKKIVEECTKRGARLAERGEFSKRAFLNGKASLDSLEGMISMINAESEAELRAASAICSGKLAKKIGDIEDRLTTILAGIEVGIDYPDEVDEEPTKEKTIEDLKNIVKEVDELLKTKKQGHLLRDGAGVVILGKPNVGKSSVLNAILGEERSIVTDIPGTTRDTVREGFVFEDVKFQIVDTAGIRETEDEVEKRGVLRSKKSAEEADVVLFVVDSSEKPSKEDEEIFDIAKTKNSILVINKTDKKRNEEIKKLIESWEQEKIEVCANTGTGIVDLLKAMKNKVETGAVGEIVLVSERHTEALLQAKEELLKIDEKMSLDVVAFCLKNALDCFGRISGKTASEEVVAKVFSTFCVGK